MEVEARFELASLGLQSRAWPLCYSTLERMTEIESAYLGWKPSAQPLGHIRINWYSLRVSISCRQHERLMFYH